MKVLNNLNEYISESINCSKELCCSRCKLPFTKEELEINEECFNCGQEIAINKVFFCGEKDEGNQENQCVKQCGTCAYIDRNFTK